MTSPSIAAPRAGRDDDRRGASLGVEGWLGLAAAPTFALMTLLTACLGSGRPDPLCSAVQAASPGGMIVMYVLMGTFHSAAWLKWIGRRHGRAHRP